ncbi:MAG: alanine racemase, partial [Actinomycetota bacterium]|nr:alanine racemase [Actinomycetota bacterium]
MDMHTQSLTRAARTAPGVNGEVVVDLDAIVHNVGVLREHAGPAAVMAVVKADGYGHGATEVARAALAAGVAELAGAPFDEALALRRDGISAPVLAWL